MNEINEEIGFLTQSEVADLLHCEVHRIIQFRKAGLLKGTRYGRRWIYSRHDVEKFVADSSGKDFTNFTDLSEKGVKKYCS